LIACHDALLQVVVPGQMAELGVMLRHDSMNTVCPCSTA
jgi:hypothetical protein